MLVQPAGRVMPSGLSFHDAFFLMPAVLLLHAKQPRSLQSHDLAPVHSITTFQVQRVKMLRPVLLAICAWQLAAF